MLVIYTYVIDNLKSQKIKVILLPETFFNNKTVFKGQNNAVCAAHSTSTPGFVKMYFLGRLDLIPSTLFFTMYLEQTNKSGKPEDGAHRDGGGVGGQSPFNEINLWL